MTPSSLRIPLIAAVALVATLSMTGTATATKTRVLLETRRHDDRITFFGGVIAKDVECTRDRKVVVREGGAPIGTARSRGHGYWEIPSFADPPGASAHTITVEVQRRRECRGAVRHIAVSY